eukprot:3523500-Amphidinium_carterae.2
MLLALLGTEMQRHQVGNDFSAGAEPVGFPLSFSATLDAVDAVLASKALVFTRVYRHQHRAKHTRMRGILIALVTASQMVNEIVAR